MRRSHDVASEDYRLCCSSQSLKGVKKSYNTMKKRTSSGMQACSIWRIVLSSDILESTVHKISFNVLYCYIYKIASFVAERFCAQKWQTGGGGFKSRSSLSIQPFGVFVVFSKIRGNTDQDPLERHPRRAFHLIVPGHWYDNWT